MADKVFDLDALEREGGEREPFVVRVSGKDVRFTDPQEKDWQDLATLSLSDPVQMLNAVVFEDDEDLFFDAEIPAWKMEKMLQAYLKHFGLPMPGESNASAGRLNRSARRSK